jgi:hypothetical protein
MGGKVCVKMFGSQVTLRPEEVGRKTVVMGGTCRGFCTAPRFMPVTWRGLKKERGLLVGAWEWRRGRR